MNLVKINSVFTVAIKSRMMKGNRTTRGVFIKDSIFNNLKTLLAEDLSIEMTAAGPVPDIKALNNRIVSNDSSLSVILINNVRNIRFRMRKVRESFKVCIESLSNSFILNLEEESNTIITNARMLIDVRNIGGKDTKELPL